MPDLRHHAVRIAHTTALRRHLESCALAMRVSTSAWVRSVVTAAPLLPDFTPPERRCQVAIARAAAALVRDHHTRRIPPDPTVVRSLARLRERLGAPVEFVPVLVQQVPPIDGLAGNQTLAVQFSEEEHERAKAAAEALGKPLGAWLRFTLAAVQVPPSPPTRITAESVARFEQLLADRRWSLLGSFARDLVGKPAVFQPTWHDLPPGDERGAWAVDEAGNVQFRAVAGAQP